MATIKNRIKKLEKLQSSGLQYLNDEKLNARISGLCKKPEIQNWLAEDTNNDPLRLRVIDLMTQQRVEVLIE